MNTYAYVGGNPIIKTDPLGLVKGNVGVCAGASLAFFVGVSTGSCVFTGTDGKVCTYHYFCVRIGAGPFVGVGTSVSGGLSGGTGRMEGFSAGIGGDLGFGGTVSAQALTGPGGISGARGGPGVGFGINIGIDLCWYELIGCEDEQCQ